MWPFTVSLAFIVVSAGLGAEGLMPGGLTGEKLPSDNDHVQEIVKKLSTDIRTQTAAKLSSSTGNGAAGNSLENDPIKVLSYKTQIVAGTNYFIKIKIGKNSVFHVRVYEDPQQNLQLSDVKGPLSTSDSIEYF